MSKRSIPLEPESDEVQRRGRERSIRRRASGAIPRRLKALRFPIFLRDSIAYSGGSLINQVSALVYSILLRRILEPAVMGLFDFATVVQGFVFTFDPGISAAAAIELPVLKGAGKEDEATTVRSTALWAELAQGILMAIGIVIFVLAGGAQGDMGTPALVAAVLVVLYSLQDSLTTMHQGNKSFVALSGAMLAAALLGAILLPGGALVGGISGLYIGAIAQSAARVGLLYFAARRVRMNIERRFEWPSFRSLIGLGFPLRVVEFPQAIFGYLDLLLVASLLGIKALAIYSFARLIFVQGANLPALVGNVFVMRAFRLTGASVSRELLAEDSKEFLLLEYLVVVPLLICFVLQAFGFLTAVVVPNYTESASPLAYLVFATFFVPQTTIIRNFWMLDRRFRSLGLSNLFGLATHGAGLGLAIWLQGLSVSSIAVGTLIGYAGYYLWIIGTIGRELWGTRAAAGVGLHAALGAGVTALVVLVVPPLAAQTGFADALGETVGNLALSYVMLVPLIAYGLWRTAALRHFRHPVTDAGDQGLDES